MNNILNNFLKFRFKILISIFDASNIFFENNILKNVWTVLIISFQKKSHNKPP